MCTVTYLPISENQFIITSNRDESVLRASALFPQIKKIGESNVLFPMDGQAGGTWIAAGSNNRIVCLMNGAFKKHIPHPPYRMSRGLVVLDIFLFGDVKKFIEEYDLNGIEPFTMLIFDAKTKIQLTELRWDGKKKFVAEINSAQPNIWASASLYSKEVIEKRKIWFNEWLETNKKYSVEAIRQFHHFGGEGDIANDVVMNRNNQLMTVSITSVEVDEQKMTMTYEDLKKGKTGVDTLNYSTITRK